MMAALFAIFFICLVLIFVGKKNLAFGLVIVNLILCLLMLLQHSTDISNIRL